MYRSMEAQPPIGKYTIVGTIRKNTPDRITVRRKNNADGMAGIFTHQPHQGTKQPDINNNSPYGVTAT